MRVAHWQIFGKFLDLYKEPLACAASIEAAQGAIKEGFFPPESVIVLSILPACGPCPVCMSQYSRRSR